MKRLWQKFLNIDYKIHLVFALTIRLILIIYGVYHDENSTVKYTDIDYKVFTDASRHVLNGNSPFDRHTYRYTPLVAIFLIPNLLIHHSFGKILFSVIDIIAAILIRTLVKHMVIEHNKSGNKQSMKVKEKIDPKRLEIKSKKKFRKHNKHFDNTKSKNENKSCLDVTADIAMVSWLYNPLTIAIGTRGNCDSIAGILVLVTLYYLQCKKQCFTAGVVHGISVHFRLYPIIYSLTYFMYLSRFSFYSAEDRRKREYNTKALENNAKEKQIKNAENHLIQQSHTGGNNIVSNLGHPKERKTIFKMEYVLYLIPNFNQLKLIAGCLISFTCLTLLFYKLYGYKFLYEGYIYHFVRKDTRHNFSLYFYLLYLTAWVRNIGIWQKVLIVLPQTVLIAVFSVRYGLNKYSLNFSILVQTIVMVIYNSVLTSQYFVWVMTIVPICLWQIKMPIEKALVLVSVWFVAQAVWLLPGYMLEFQGENTFLYIWTQSVSFFCANIVILGRLIKYFQPTVQGKVK